ncbi:competence type IV pilus ATPase ComGA [uncultured Limosilactobacillus sp.]|uniref:competence type IV pilus ATPase ComGA n=1 Tax=uncultured Limosilactobacillus sp. TaxID=2837629 RepID=UPI0025E7C73E|nr:competence type IV pilus ATPase ComGA [uncultured Limosilactobacillus sp.]
MNPEKYVQQLFKVVYQRTCTDVYLLLVGANMQILGQSNQGIIKINQLSCEDGRKIIAYLKYQANMTVSEHRRPQSGAWQWKFGKELINIRLSTVGDFRGTESLVLRFIYPLKQLKYQMLKEAQWNELKQMASRAGLVLFAGPMGSGKTTTMYRLAKDQYQQSVVLTIEDPVEVVEDTFIQLQVNNIAGMGYQELLRLALRHRPQVLIIGEIRDPITAQTVIEASLSGHLVLATIHAKSAGGVIPRLKQLGIEQYYIDQALRGACYQRLIPLSNHQEKGVLFDLKTLIELQKNQGSDIGEQWKKILQTAVKEGKITSTTAQAFWQG